MSGLESSQSERESFLLIPFKSGILVEVLFLTLCSLLKNDDVFFRSVGTDPNILPIIYNSPPSFDDCDKILLF